MTLRRFLASATLATLACSAPASADTRARMDENRAVFERFAGPPIEEIRRFRLQRWRPLGELTVAVWISPQEVFLLDVARPCTSLEYAKSLGVSARQRVLSARFDRITVEGERCRIERIRPVDWDALHAAAPRLD
jgi:hypothetical protein